MYPFTVNFFLGKGLPSTALSEDERYLWTTPDKHSMPVDDTNGVNGRE